MKYMEVAMKPAKHPKAKIFRWRGPKYPAQLIKLAEVYAAHPKFGIDTLTRAAEPIMGFVRNTKFKYPTSDDGYQWCYALEFEVIGGRVLITFPCRQGDQLERLPAVYTSRRFVPPFEVDSVLTALTRELRRS